MPKFQFKGKVRKRKKKRKKRSVSMYTILTGKPTGAPVVSPVGKYRFKGQTKRKTKAKIANEKMNEFADCLISLHGEWSSLREGKVEALACLDSLLKEVKRNKRAKQEIRRAQLNINRIEKLSTLISYCYQLKLKLAGLSINRVLRSK